LLSILSLLTHILGNETFITDLGYLSYATLKTSHPHGFPL
jgi:hypothetical protein